MLSGPTAATINNRSQTTSSLMLIFFWIKSTRFVYRISLWLYVGKNELSHKRISRPGSGENVFIKIHSDVWMVHSNRLPHSFRGRHLQRMNFGSEAGGRSTYSFALGERRIPVRNQDSRELSQSSSTTTFFHIFFFFWIIKKIKADNPVRACSRDLPPQRLITDRKRPAA